MDMNHKVSYKRHLAKTISYRIISSLIGFLTLWFVTNDVHVGAIFSLMEFVYKPIQYFIHERVWYKWIKFGLVPQKQNDNLINKTDQ